MTRTGKIARLPREVREELNRRLQNGEQGKRLVVWLNSMPEVRQRLEKEFGGRTISEQNLSEWKQGGFREWQAHQDAVLRAGELASAATELNSAAAGMTDHLATVLAARYTAALAEWDGDPDGGVGRKLRVLRALCQDVVELRRGDHSAARLKIEQERSNRERDETEEEVVAHFQRWAKNPKVREAICGNCVSVEERERRLREIFGLPTGIPVARNETAAPTSNGNTAAHNEESNSIQPNQTHDSK